MVFAGSDATLFAYAAATGEPQWRGERAGVSRALEIAGDRVLAASGSPDFLVRAFAADSGAAAALLRGPR